MTTQIRIDFSGIVDAIGDSLGFCDGVSDDTYMESLINLAHNTASAEFDLDMAAGAAAGNMTHMYEFGVRGITRGDPKFPDPTRPEARLWVHALIGKGPVQMVTYAFRPAVAPNPRPTTSFTGVESKVLRRLSRKKYVFRQKASIIENGESVRIKPKTRPFNFVPFYGKPARNPLYENRTHIFRPIEGRAPMNSTPGEESGQRGTFGAFWTMWWMGQGQNLMGRDMNEQVIKDMTWIMERPSPPGLENVLRYNSRGRIYNRRRKMRNRMIRQAQTRGGRRT